MKDYYHILGINATSDKAGIRKAWKTLAVRYHPDHNPENPDAEEKFKEVQEAYSVLSDEQLRADYDLGGLNFKSGRFNSRPVVNHYFYAICNKLSVLCFEEISITFTYSGDGRIFRKPSFQNFHITGTPYVSSRMVRHEGTLVKETSLTYIVCPLHEGTLKILPATIRIQNNQLSTSAFSIQVHPAKCYFTGTHHANGKPFKLIVHYEFDKGKEPLRISESMKNHSILIPRSKTAYLFHILASLMKFICMLYGIFAFNTYFGLGIIPGLILGGIVGGLNVHLMYFLLKIKSKFYFASRNSVVQDYLERGFYLGESSGIPLIKGNSLYNLFRLLS